MRILAILLVALVPLYGCGEEQVGQRDTIEDTPPSDTGQPPTDDAERPAKPAGGVGL